MQYLSDQWIEAADTALSDAWTTADPGETDADAADDPATTIVYTVTGAPAGKVTYSVHFGPDGAGVSAEPSADPDATMALDYDTAVEIAQGEASAQAAFMQGRLKLGGDVTVLIRGAARLAAVGDALAPLRDTTEY